MTELRALTSARGLAAWLVVLYHIRLSIAGLPSSVLAVFGKGYLAVDFFFLLSGFVIALTWTERLGGWAQTRRFWWKRVARVYPLHLVMLGVAVALALLLASTGRADARVFPPAELPLHLLLLQNWGFTDALSWNNPAWSISAEAVAYLLFPLFALLVDWRRWPGIAVLGGIGTLLAGLYGVMTLSGAATLGIDIPHLGLPRCLCEFLAGTGLADLWRRWRARPLLPAILCAAVAAGGGVLTRHLPETATVPATFAAALLALALTAGQPRNPLEWAPLHYLGRISYATYLSHWLLFFAFKLAFVSDPLAVPPALIALYLLLVLATSIALYHLIELPAQRRLTGGPLLTRNDAGVRALPGHGSENRLFG